MQTHMGMSRSANGLAQAAASIQIAGTAVALSDPSRVMNTELVNVLRTQSLLQSPPLQCPQPKRARRVEATTSDLIATQMQNHLTIH